MFALAIDGGADDAEELAVGAEMREGAGNLQGLAAGEVAGGVGGPVEAA